VYALRDQSNPSASAMALLFQSTFAVRFDECHSRLIVLHAAIRAVQDSGPLRVVMHAIRAAAAEMNESTAAEEGFRLDSLKASWQTKAFDNRTTVLQFLAWVMLRGGRSPEDLDLARSLGPVRDASRYSFEDIHQMKASLSTELRSAGRAVRDHVRAEGSWTSGGGGTGGRQRTGSSASGEQGISGGGAEASPVGTSSIGGMGLGPGPGPGIGTMDGGRGRVGSALSLSGALSPVISTSGASGAGMR